MSILHINHLGWWAWCQSLSPLLLPSHFVLPWFLLIFANSPYILHYFCFIMLPYCRKYTFIFIFVAFIVEVVACSLTMVLVVCNHWMVLNFEWIEKSLDLGGEGAYHNEESRYILYEPLYFQFHSTFYVIKNVSSWFCNLSFLLQ
jgi:hypothetical protein